MGKLAIWLLVITFISVLIFPPIAAIVVPGCSLIWIIAWLNNNT